MDDRSSARSVHSLPDLASSLFSLILSLRGSSAYGQEADLRARSSGVDHQDGFVFQPEVATGRQDAVDNGAVAWSPDRNASG